MEWNLDTIIFVGFLIANVILGLGSSRGVKTIGEFAVGNRDFSTATIAATIIATWVSGEFFFTITSETYVNGLNFIWVAALGDFIAIASIGLLFAPRMGEFLGKLSIAEAMGDLFGTKVRIVTAISGFVGVCGLIALQFKISGLVFEYALGLPEIYGVLIAAIVVTLYSALGGIRSVTFTDVIQFFTFGTVIPTISYVILKNIDDSDAIINTITRNPLFDFKTTFDFSSTRSLYYLFLFMFIAMPCFTPAIFQRIAMAKNVTQVKQSFVVAAMVCLFLVLMVSWIAVLMLSHHPNIAPNDVVKHIIFDYSLVVGFKGLVLAGIMAMVMSTVDSYINATSVIIVHDFLQPLGIKFIKNELLSARFMSVALGILATILALADTRFLEAQLVIYSFYMPIVTVPFIMAVFGFRSSGKSVLIGMAAGLITVISWDYVLHIEIVNSVPPAMLANLCFLLASHYILRQPGGWVGVKDMEPVLQLRQERNLKCKKFWKDVKNFSLIALFNRNTPKGDGFISILGFFVMISVFGSMHSLTHAHHIAYAKILDILYPIGICSSTALISYPLWLQPWKASHALGIIWNVIMFFVLICFSFFMILVSNFGEIQLMVFLVNVIMIASIMKWRWTLLTIIFGVFATYSLHDYYFLFDVSANMFSSQFKIVYMLLILSSTLLIFLKPKEDQIEFQDLKIHFLEDESIFHKQEISRLFEIKSEFLRNIEHESRTPITGITSMAQVLEEAFDKLPPAQIKDGIRDIIKSSERLNSWASNFVDLARLVADSNNKLVLEDVNLSELIEERLGVCIKLYIDENHQRDRVFQASLGENITITCDKYYMIRVLDNLIINAIQYCKRGRIELTLRQLSKNKSSDPSLLNDNTIIEFSISDEGVGIPFNSLRDIFGLLTTSAKTKSSAGGRGVGLALCKKVLELHGGKIWAESDGVKGAIIRFRV